MEEFTKTELELLTDLIQRYRTLMRNEGAEDPAAESVLKKLEQASNHQ